MKKALGLLAIVVAASLAPAGQAPPASPARGSFLVPASQNDAEAERKSRGCKGCHTTTDQASMHRKAQPIGCSDCHGGDPAVLVQGAPGSLAYQQAKSQAHVQPRDGRLFAGARNPERAYTAWLDEDLELVRFVNPGDLRAARFACGPCHDTAAQPIVRNVARSPMTHGAMLYGAALYNNGVLPDKTPIIGESYGPDGTPQRLLAATPPTEQEQREKGRLPLLVPFPRFELARPGNPFRVFEPGGRRRPEPGLPDPDEDPGRPDKGLSPRGPGTLGRTDPLVLGAQKTRLLDPLLSLPGTNDHAGDYRASGCSACHVVYANDRSPVASGSFAAAGNRGESASSDPTIPRGVSGHPLRHEFTSGIPTSQCITCHMHPGTNMLATYLGYTWWDNEADGALLYPPHERRLGSRELDEIERANPEGSAPRGLWSIPEFLSELQPRVNPLAERTQFADFHGHGWVFRKVFARDRAGRLLDATGAPVAETDPRRFGPSGALHLQDVHAERGMHCVDCHFERDVHGDGHLYGEPRAAIEIDCVDCHGTLRRRAPILDGRPSGPSADAKSRPLGERRTPFGGRPRFDEVERDGRTLVVQRSMLRADLEWEVPQVVDSVTPGSPRYNERSRLAKTLQRDGSTWGDEQAPPAQLAHADENMTCYACHSSWTTSCFGCHLRTRANARKPELHNEGASSRNWTSYNFQTLRDDIYFLARNGPLVSGGSERRISDRIAPARSACSVLVSSENANRELVYSQRQMISSAGLSATAFSTYVPHTVRGRETKGCSDCHLSRQGDNNAWMAQLLMHGTGLTNFIGRFAWLAEGDAGLEAVAVTERGEPQAVLGSSLHRLAYPREHAAHEARGRRLTEAFGRGGSVRSLQAYGEYVLALGERGLLAYDAAAIDNKGWSQRILGAPVSPLGQRLQVGTRAATSLALPTTQTLDGERVQRPANLEQPVHPLYGYAFVTDREEGLVVVGPLRTLTDGDPTNNRLVRAATFDGGGALRGATSLTLAGSVGYVATEGGVVVVDLDDPLRPRVLARLGAPLQRPRALAVQFRYAFVCDERGVSVLDVTLPERPRLLPAHVPLLDARRITLARGYAYVAAGRAGLAILDVTRPESPRLEQAFDAGGRLDDVSDVQIGMTNGSAFAYLADGRNGLRVLEILSANATPGAYGFNPRPTPVLIASYKTKGPALALSRGLDRDRAVDETGHQIAVFGRRGARPLNLEEQRRMYLRDGRVYTVDDAPPGPPLGGHR